MQGLFLWSVHYFLSRFSFGRVLKAFLQACATKVLLKVRFRQNDISDPSLNSTAFRPTGKKDKIGGIDVYIATPSVEYPKDKVVLYLTDAFGLELENNLVSCDLSTITLRKRCD